LPGPAPNISGEGMPANRQITDSQTRKRLYHVSFLIDSGKLQQAGTEIDKLQMIYPSMPEVLALRRRWQSAVSIQEQGHQEEEQRETIQKPREDALGAKATLLLDGRSIGKEGEIENRSTAAGRHAPAIANGGGLVASRDQEPFEGQRATSVPDSAGPNLRLMGDSDRESAAKKKAMDAVHTFELDHEHGIFRGSCHGVLAIDFYDIAYKPSSGWHGFRIPFKLLRLGRIEGKSVELFYISDGMHFQTFNLQDNRAVEQFKQVWGELKNLARQ